MRTTSGLEIIESCVLCPHQKDRIFCNLPAEAIEGLAAITAVAAYEKGAMLFMEGEPPRGVFILCSGRVKLSASSGKGKTLIVRFSRPGEVLGLPATVTGKPYELTAEVAEPTQANFIARVDFIQFLREHGEAALRVAQQLGDIYQTAVSEMRTLGLSGTAGEKLARFLLELLDRQGKTEDETKLTLTLTHEAIAQAIGASRETVTRLFSEFKKKRLLEVKGATVIIKSREDLENFLE